MRFVKTPDEVRSIQAIYARPQFLATRSLTVIFETTPEAVRLAQGAELVGRSQYGW